MCEDAWSSVVTDIYCHVVTQFGEIKERIIGASLNESYTCEFNSGISLIYVYLMGEKAGCCMSVQLYFHEPLASENTAQVATSSNIAFSHQIIIY